MKVKIIMLFVVAFVMTGCIREADVAFHNLSVAAEQFEIDRRIVFYNGITGEYMLTVEGRCSIYSDNIDRQLELTCKTGPNTFKKHFLGLVIFKEG